VILPAAYAQVLGLGVLWTSVHCIGMCGPLLAGFDIAGVMRGRSRLLGVCGVLLYQAGRGLTYAWLGGLAGLVGAGLARITTLSFGILALGTGLILSYSALRSLQPVSGSATQLVTLRSTRKTSNFGLDMVERVVAHGRRSLLPLLSSRHPLRELALGALMGLLPCMIPAWALSQAALTGSPFHGALVMLLLIVLTTPVLLISTQLPRLLGLLPDSLRVLLPKLFPVLSGVWLILIGGAGLGLWSHAHLALSVVGKPFLMMIF